MSVSEWLDLEAQTTHARQLAEARRDRDSAKQIAAAFEKENSELRQALSLLRRIEGADPSPPKWLTPVKPASSHATLMLILSDLHFDERVRADEVDGLNAFDRQIATLRLEKWCRNVIKLARHYLAGVTYDGVVLMLGGDIFSGNIHDELKETNEDTLFGSLLYWAEQLAAAVDCLAGEFGKIYVPSVPGNHGRQTRKPRAKLRARDNLDWLLAQMLANQYRRDNRVTVDCPDSSDLLFHVYDKGHLLTHGDQVKGGGGIGGIWPPIMRMRARKAQHHMSIGKPFETLWMGHWHQYIAGPGLVVNGTLKGWDEYSRLANFGYASPSQAMALTTPEHGITWQAPVFCMDRAKEGW